MLGAMQDWELRVTKLLDHAASQHAEREIVTRWADGTETRTDWAGIRRDALKMTQALRRQGIGPGDRVATLAMNHSRHLVTWYGAVGVGAILHTVNPRLFDDQLDFIVNHAEDRTLIYDAAFQSLVDRMKPRWKTIEHYICFDAATHAPFFEDWIGGESDDAPWVEGDEREPCMLCYTSGTTGNPKGVLFEHRSTVLHAITALQPAGLNIDARAVILPVVPMFHAASWGLPWAGAAAGAKFVYSQGNDPNVICELIRQEQVDNCAGVPAVWLGMFQHIDTTGTPLPSLKQVLTGGSAAPRYMVERLMKMGIRIGHAWGMTETSPIATTSPESWDWDALTFDEQVTRKAMQGKPPFGVELRCLDLEDPAKVLPWDGVTPGALQVRGAWVVKRYFKAGQEAVGPDQWFDTGDVAVIHPDGMLQITDRTKDVIKSGGEWISSVDLENAAVGHPGVAEAAAIGMPHPRWDERPVLFVVRKPGAEVTAQDMRAFLADKVAKWWLPDAVEFVDMLPHTGTGKISKKELREQFRDYRLTE
jgi:fatty-acyl-CoA synthase